MPKMAPISAFAAYKSSAKQNAKKNNKKKQNRQESKKKDNKNKAKQKLQNKTSPSNQKAKKKRLIIKDDNHSEEEEILTYEQFIARGLELSHNDSTESIDGSYTESYEERMQDGDSDAAKESLEVKPLKRKNQSSLGKVTLQNKKKRKQVDSKLQAAQNGTHKIQENTSTSNKSNSTTSKRVTAIKILTSNMSNSTENIARKNSITAGETALQWVINPITLKNFFSTYWEQNTLYVKRRNPEYYSSLISFKAIDQMLLDHHVEFTKNIDVTTYESGVRETHNPEGRALPPAVWDFYRDGCSVRLLNPQTFLNPLHELCATLQEYFHCLVGANAYLTPPNSQGFAPHYDDIEAFVLQVEGRKRWKVYSPRSPTEVLPRYSSKNFTQDEIGEPILDQVLEPGDLLYFPRGAIHQACTEPGFHSLHITLSVYQKQSYADLLEKMLPVILKSAIDSNVNLRRGLPLNIWHNAGLVYNEIDTEERDFLQRKVTKILGECLHSVQLSEVMDAAVDELAKKFQHEALPPHISPAEKQHTIFGLRNEADKGGDCPSNCPITLRTNVRLLRANILRLVAEEEQYRIYYYLDNSKEYCEYEPNFFEIEHTLAASVEVLIKSYPEFVSVSQLPLQDDESKLDLATCLWKRGLLMTEKPIQN